MSFRLRIRSASGEVRFAQVERERFWIASGDAGSAEGPSASGAQDAVEVPVAGLRGPLVEVERDEDGIRVRAEPGLPIEVKTLAGRVGGRFVPLIDGEALEVGEHRIELQWDDDAADADALRALDARLLADGGNGDLEQWYESLMGLADQLEGLRSLDEMAELTLEGLLKATGCDRCFLQIELSGEAPREWFRSRQGGSQAFGVSRSLVDRVRKEQGVVYVPESAADPSVSGLLSVRREGIASSLAVPLRALGRSVGVLYADCIEVGSQLASGDFQIAALVGRMLAGAIGSRDLVRSVLDSGVPLALRTRSPACRSMVENARLFAPTDYTILIRGETGAGKEVLARALHEVSRRSAGPFVAVNCAAIPAQLMESELFGHVKGSFTGAEKDRDGLVVEASGGTLFLDEIGDMEVELQAKMLRALETKEVLPVGASQTIPVDVRILAATHQNLEDMVREGRFREDLYYRLKELEVRIPPLRERPEDIPELAELFLEEAANEMSLGKRPQLAPDAVRLLVEHEWHGNVRELKHAMRTALLRAGGEEVGVEHLEIAAPIAPRADASAAAVEPGEGQTWKDKLDEQEREALERTLRQAGGNLTKAAMLFGLPRTTYRERLVKHGLLE